MFNNLCLDLYIDNHTIKEEYSTLTTKNQQQKGGILVKPINADKKVKKTQKALSLFGRNVGQMLFIGLGQLAQALKKSKGGIMSTVGKLLADNKVFAATNRAGEIVYACRLPKVFKYTSWELIEHLADSHFNLVGKWLERNFSEKQKIELNIKKLEAHEKELEMPGQFIFYFIQCFIDCGLVKVDENKNLSLVSKGASLSATSLRKVAVARSLRAVAHKRDDVLTETDPFRILQNLHARHEENAKLITIPIEVEGSFRIHHICEVRIGHQDTDFAELEATVIGLEATLPANRPQVIVVSGLIQGTFQHIQKNRRNTLVGGLKSDGQQLVIAKTLMKRISALGVKVVLNMSDDDKLWCENTTVFMMKALEAQGRASEKQEEDGAIPDNKKKSAHFMQVDRMKGTKIWDTIYDFVWRVSIEYQIRVGFRPRSADETSAITNGATHMEESLLLMDAYHRLINGEVLTADHAILEVDKIPLPGKVFDDFTVVDDCKFDVLIKDKASGTERRLSIMEKHFFRLTANSMVGDPTSAARAITAQLNSMKADKPDVVFIEHEQQAFVFATNHTLVASLPGMQKMNIGRRSQFANVQSDPSHRVMTTRKDVFGGGTMPITFYPDGSFEVFMADRRLMEKSAISEQRIKIPFMVDWQNGSITANADLQAIFMDYTMHHLLPYHPTWIFYGGDHVQGNNYPTHCFESQRVGLVSVDDQKIFVGSLIKCSLAGASKKDIKEHLKHVGIVPGNHEWNSGYKNLGVVHCDYIKSAWELALVHCGIYTPAVPWLQSSPRVEIYDTASDNAGNNYRVWAGHEEIGGYGFRVQHLIVERGTKGQGGPPVYALKSQLIGNSESFKGVDLLATGHWHSPQVLKMGNVIGMVSGSLAGTSGYEYLKALHATVGCSVISVGGGLPPSILFLNAEALSRYEPKGFYSRKNLASLGFKNDDGFDRLKHGFIRIDGQPQSAIQKFLWNIIDSMNRNKGSILGS